jgi:hypothetical protein
VPALFWEEEPGGHHALVVGNFFHVYGFIGDGRYIHGVLVGTMVSGLLGRELVPLFAGHLTTSAGRAFGQINEE